jgi:hypothetical protein
LCEGVHDCQPYGGRERGWADRANGRALLLNVVSSNKPKGLHGVAPKGWGPGETRPPRLPQMPRHRRTGRADLLQWASGGTW